jgi:hypothetical protein
LWSVTKCLPGSDFLSLHVFGLQGRTHIWTKGGSTYYPTVCLHGATLIQSWSWRSYHILHQRAWVSGWISDNVAVWGHCSRGDPFIYNVGFSCSVAG